MARTGQKHSGVASIKSTAKSQSIGSWPVYSFPLDWVSFRLWKDVRLTLMFVESVLRAGLWVSPLKASLQLVPDTRNLPHLSFIPDSSEINLSGKEGSLVPFEPEKIFLISKIAVIFKLRSAHHLVKTKRHCCLPAASPSPLWLFRWVQWYYNRVWKSMTHFKWYYFINYK